MIATLDINAEGNISHQGAIPTEVAWAEPTKTRLSAVGSELHITAPAGDMHSTDSSFKMTEEALLKKWTTRQEKEFDQLAVQDALGQLSEKLAERMAFLTAERRRLRLRLSAEEVMETHRRRVALQELLEHVEKYTKIAKLEDYR